MRAAKAFVAIFLATVAMSLVLSLVMYAVAMSAITIGAAFGPFGVMGFIFLFAGFIAGLLAACAELSK